MRAFGRFRVAAVEAGRFYLDGGALYGVVPRPVWEKAIKADEHNRVQVAARTLLVADDTQSPPRILLIDTGLGDRFSARERAWYSPCQPQGGLEEALRTAGIAPDDVTDVLLTHLHFDHAGGAVQAAKDGRLVPAFRNATYHLQRRAFKWPEHAPEKDRLAFRQDDYAPLAQHGQLHLLDGPFELWSGIEVLVSEGHTVGMQLPLIDGGEQGKLLYSADITPTRAHVRLPWIAAADLYPLTTLEEKRLLLAQGLEENWLLFFCHDPTESACRLSERDGVVIPGDPLPL